MSQSFVSVVGNLSLGAAAAMGAFLVFWVLDRLR